MATLLNDHETIIIRFLSDDIDSINEESSDLLLLDLLRGFLETTRKDGLDAMDVFLFGRKNAPTKL